MGFFANASHGCPAARSHSTFSVVFINIMVIFPLGLCSGAALFPPSCSHCWTAGRGGGVAAAIMSLQVLSILPFWVNSGDELGSKGTLCKMPITKTGALL